MRSRKPEFVGFSRSPDRGIDWKLGDEIKLRLRLYSFQTPDIAGLLDRFATVRKAVTGPNHPRNTIPQSEVARRMTRRIDSRFHDGNAYKFYCPENAPWISFGWIGGLIDTYPMLALGDDKHLRRVTETFDFVISRAQGKAGYFYGLLDQDGSVRGREGYDDRPEICLTRKNGDVLFWMIKQFELLKAQKKSDAINPRLGTVDAASGRCLRGHLEKASPMGQFRQRRYGRCGRLQLHGRRDGRRRARARGGLFPQSGIPRHRKTISPVLLRPRRAEIGHDDRRLRGHLAKRRFGNGRRLHDLAHGAVRYNGRYPMAREIADLGQPVRNLGRFLRLRAAGEHATRPTRRETGRRGLGEHAEQARRFRASAPVPAIRS